MGNCIITRKSGGGAEGGFNYVDNNLGIIYPINITGNKRLIIENNQIQMEKDYGITAEICCKVTPPSKNSRLFEIGDRNLCLASLYRSSRDIYMIDISVGDWLYADTEDRQEIPLNSIHTYSLAITPTSVNLYVDGQGLFVTSRANSSSIETITAGSKILYLMGGLQGDRTSPGDLYAFRFYNKVLSTNEIAQNYEEDQKLVALLNNS